MVNQLNTQEANRRYYDKYGKYYEEYHAYFRNTLLLRQWNKNMQRIKNAILPSRNMRALDFGCGTGLLTFMLLKMGFSVTAVDISEKMLEELQDRANNLPKNITKRLKCIHGGIEVLETLPRESFSLVSESSVLQHVEDYVSFMQLSQHLLIPGGVLYIGREPLNADELPVHKIKFPFKVLHVLICKIDKFFDRGLSKGKFKEVFDESILPHYRKGGVSCEAFIEAGKKLEMYILFKRIYNWHRSKQAYFLNNILPRCLRYEKFRGTFFDIAFIKKKKNA